MIELNTKLTSSQKGEIVELKCQAYLLEKGWNVTVPCGNFLTYDLLIERNGKCRRIQCKKSTPTENGFRVKTVHDSCVDGKVKQVPYTTKDCDYFMTEAYGNFYILPVTNTTKITLRTTPATNKKQKDASLYLADEVLKIIESLM